MSQVNNTTKERCWKQLSEKERYKIEALFEQGLSSAQIGAALKPSRDRRTIERERRLGLVEQKRLNPSNSKKAGEELYIVEMVYRADTAQRRHNERASNKGRGLKIGHDHKLATYIESKIKNDKWSPDVVLGRIKEQGLVFETSICTKTLYSYIEQGIFAELSNKDLWAKKDGKKRDYRRIRTVALNNKNGKSTGAP